MKNLFKTVALAGVVAAIAFSCEKEELAPVQETTVENTRILDVDPEPYGPDLVVTLINTNLPFVSPSACGGAGPTQQPSCFGLYRIKVKVTNIGNAATGSHYDILIDKTTGLTQSHTLTSPSSSLAPGATDIFDLGPIHLGGCTAPFSRQKIFVTADINNDVVETNEANNTPRPYQYCGD